jgi:hypothetical protein
MWRKKIISFLFTTMSASIRWNPEVFSFFFGMFTAEKPRLINRVWNILVLEHSSKKPDWFIRLLSSSQHEYLYSSQSFFSIENSHDKTYKTWTQFSRLGQNLEDFQTFQTSVSICFCGREHKTDTKNSNGSSEMMCKQMLLIRYFSHGRNFQPIRD